MVSTINCKYDLEENLCPCFSVANMGKLYSLSQQMYDKYNKNVWK